MCLVRGVTAAMMVGEGGRGGGEGESTTCNED
jgi:hypothetical protein